MKTTDASDRRHVRGDAKASVESEADQFRIIEQLAASAIEQPDKLPVADFGGDNDTVPGPSPLTWEYWLVGFVALAVVANGIYRWVQFLG